MKHTEEVKPESQQQGLQCKKCTQVHPGEDNNHASTRLAAAQCSGTLGCTGSTREKGGCFQ